MPEIPTFLVRFLHKSGPSPESVNLRRTAGAGFFISGKHLVTCAHVVTEALGLDPEELSAPDELVPFVCAHGGDLEQVLFAKVVAWKPVANQAIVQDIAVLQLINGHGPDNQGVVERTIPLLSLQDCRDHPFLTYGFPHTTNNDAVPAQGKIGLPRGSGWISFQADELVGEFVERGYSGAPVWDERMKGVVGMVVTAKEADRSGAMVPVEHLRQTWPAMEPLLQHVAPPPLAGPEGAYDPQKALIHAIPLQATLDLRTLFPEQESIEKAQHRRRELEFLERMETFIRDQLAKSGDQHFVELSMKLSNPREIVDESFQRNVSFALVLGDTHLSQNIIPSLEQLDVTWLSIPGRSLVMLAPPGSGKTTVLHHLTLRMVGNYRREESSLLPLFVPLTKYPLKSDMGDVRPILAFLKEWVAQLMGEEHFVVQRFDDLARFGRFAVILDGLDQMVDRKSETARLKDLHKVETSLRRIDTLRVVTQIFGRKGADSFLLGNQQSLAKRIAPQIDPREQQIALLPEKCPCPVITSCRLHDFIGVPKWQQIQVLPMSQHQIREFIQKYAPEALPIVENQWETAGATRSLVSNPFYLRILTKAFEYAPRRPDGTLTDEFFKAIEKRGQLLRFLILGAIEREVAGRSESSQNYVALKSDEVMHGLGELAYHMLENNVIGAVPTTVIERWLGTNSEPILKVASNVGLLEIRPGPPEYIEFNHQLFLETLLAFYLLQQSEREGGFEGALKLLAYQGDRWAETIKLLFEMAPANWGDNLVAKVVDGLGSPSTWDLSKRVLSEVGRKVAPRLVPLLQDSNSLTRRGVAEVLGNIKATEYEQYLVDLNKDPAWEVRRAAVESLIKIGEFDAIEKYAGDAKPAVLRSVCRGRLLNAADPVLKVKELLTTGEMLQREQSAWATLDLFEDLSKSITTDPLTELLELMIRHESNSVRVLGYLAITRSQDEVKFRLKSILLKSALQDRDSTINYLACYSVAQVLDKSDIKYIETQAKLAPVNPFQTTPAMSAHWLLAEVQNRQNPQSYFSFLRSTQPEQLKIITRRQAKRGDPVSFAVLTYLLSDPLASMAAFEALTSVRPEGAAYLLKSLDDPLLEVQRGAATILNHCRMPRRFRQRLKAVLKRDGIRTHKVDWLGMYGLTPDFSETQRQQAAGVRISAFWPVIKLGFAAGVWSATRLVGIQLPFWFWWKFQLFNSPISIETIQRQQINPITRTQFEEDAFATAVPEPTTEFWIARARLLRSIGNTNGARLCLDRCLAQESTNAAARFEMAVVLRAGSDLENALRYLEIEEFDLAKTDTRIANLRELISAESRLSQGDDGTVELEERRTKLMVTLNLWDDALKAIQKWCVNQSYQLPQIYYLLFQCYRGQNRYMRAVAAAVANNQNLGESDIRIPQVEIDNLRWRYRHVSLGSLLGELGMLVDMGSYANALALLRKQGVLPEKGQPCPPDMFINLRRMLDQPDAKSDLFTILEFDQELGLLEQLREYESVDSQLEGLAQLDDSSELEDQELEDLY